MFIGRCFLKVFTKTSQKNSLYTSPPFFNDITQSPPIVYWSHLHWDNHGLFTANGHVVVLWTLNFFNTHHYLYKDKALQVFIFFMGLYFLIMTRFCKFPFPAIQTLKLVSFLWHGLKLLMIWKKKNYSPSYDNPQMS